MLYRVPSIQQDRKRHRERLRYRERRREEKESDGEIRRMEERQRERERKRGREESETYIGCLEGAWAFSQRVRSFGEGVLVGDKRETYEG